MARLLKILLLLIAAFIGVGVLASIALFLFFDPNDFRDEISDAVQKTTGRELNIEGDIELSIFPWIAVEIGSTRLGNAEGFGDEPFLSFDRARLSVRLVPLLFRQEIAVGTASLDRLVVNLQVNQSGVSNWDDLADAGEEATTEADDEESTGTASIDIANVAVTNASISYIDAAAGSSSSISDLTLETGKLQIGSPFDLNAGFTFDSNPADIGGDVSVTATVLLGAGMANVSISDLSLSGTLAGIAAETTEFNFDARAMEIDTEAQSVILGEMDMGVLGLSMTANVAPFSYANEPRPKATITVHEFSLKELMRTLGEEPPVTADENALQRVSFSANAVVGATSIALTDLQLSLDDTGMVGTMSLPTTDDGQLLFDLAVDSMVLDHYMAPASETDAEAVESGDVNVEIPTDMIRALNAKGKFTMEQATMSGIFFENMELGLLSADGKLRLHPITAEMFDGNYKGDIRIDASGDEPAISVNENIVDVQMSSLAKAMYGVDNVSGTINGSFVLAGSGADLNEIRQDLHGNMSFVLADGAWLGTDIWHELRKARAKLKQEPAPEPVLPARTEFTAVSASGVVTNGVMQNNDFLAELPYLRLTGAGKVDFVTASVDYRMDARVVESPELAGEISAEELKDFTSAIIPLKISGPLASPSVVVDIDAMIRKEVEKQLEKEADKLIDRLFGKDEEPADGESEDEEEEEEEDEEPDAEDLIKDALKNIFKN
jgi:AsmA protein